MTHNTPSTHETRTDEETEGQGGEVTGLKHTELGRDGAMIQTTVHFKVPFLILPLLKYLYMPPISLPRNAT